MQYKTTKKLFMGKYQYKVVLVCAGAAWFRNKNLEYTEQRLKLVDVSKALTEWQYGIRTEEDFDYALTLLNTFKKLENYTIRVEGVWLSLYSNSYKDIKQVASIKESNVKYICQPEFFGKLEQNTVVMPKIPYDFKVTVSKTTSSHTSFVDWATSNNKVKLTKTCIRDLIKDRSRGGSYFYVSGDKTLLMAKMHLGGAIGKIERIIKA